MYVTKFVIDGGDDAVEAYVRDINAIHAVNVRNYGAVGDGVTDDSAAINNALSVGGDVIIPDGTYVVHDLEVPSNTSVIGHNAKLVLANGGNNIIRNDSDGSGGYLANKRIKICGIEFDGQGAMATLIALSHADFIEICHCNLHDIHEWHFIELNGCQNVHIHDNYFHDYRTGNARSEMIQLDFGTQEGVFPWFGPWDGTGNNNIVVENNVFDNANYTNDSIEEYGVAAIGNHTGYDIELIKHNNISILNNKISNMGYGFSFVNLGNAVIANNCVYNVHCGFRLRGAGVRVNLVDNVFVGRNGTGQRLENERGISAFRTDSLKGFSEFNISNNIVKLFGGHGIAANGEWGNISGNVVSACMGAGIYALYASFMVNISNNDCYNNSRDTQYFADLFCNQSLGGTSKSCGGCTVQDNNVGSIYLNNDTIAVARKDIVCDNKAAYSMTIGTAENVVSYGNRLNGVIQS